MQLSAGRMQLAHAAAVRNPSCVSSCCAARPDFLPARRCRKPHGRRAAGSAGLPIAARGRGARPRCYTSARRNASRTAPRAPVARRRFMTSECPDRCSHPTDWGIFDIKAYLDYEKPGAAAVRSPPPACGARPLTFWRPPAGPGAARPLLLGALAAGCTRCAPRGRARPAAARRPPAAMRPARAR